MGNRASSDTVSTSGCSLLARRHNGAKLPFSSLLAYRHNPVPSQKSALALFLSRPTKRKTSPDRKSRPSACVTSPLSASKLLRMSHGCP